MEVRSNEIPTSLSSWASVQGGRMHDRDIAEKQLFDYDDVFADIISYTEISTPSG